MADRGLPAEKAFARDGRQSIPDDIKTEWVNPVRLYKHKYRQLQDTIWEHVR